VGSVADQEKKKRKKSLSEKRKAAVDAFKKRPKNFSFGGRKTEAPSVIGPPPMVPRWGGPVSEYWGGS